MPTLRRVIQLALGYSRQFCFCIFFIAACVLASVILFGGNDIQDAFWNAPSEFTKLYQPKPKFVISMSLYGNSPKYVRGALRNAELAKKNFPDWTFRIYTEKPSETPKSALVNESVVDELRNLGVKIFYMVPKEDGHSIPPMMWRFLVGDDTTVDRFIIRDTDSRLTERDAAAVKAWVDSGAAFHCIRDHPSHGRYPISGGLCGGWPLRLRPLMKQSWTEMMLPVVEKKSPHYLQDMNFLNSKVWPLVKNDTYCSDSVSCEKYPGAHPFPVKRIGYEHVGEVYDANDVGRAGDINILRRAGENSKCVPSDEKEVVGPTH